MKGHMSAYSCILAIMVAEQQAAVLELEQDSTTQSSTLSHRHRTYLYRTSDYTSDQEHVLLAAVTP